MKPLIHDTIITHSKPAPLIQELHAAHKARRERWWARPPKPAPAPALLPLEPAFEPAKPIDEALPEARPPQHDSHVILWFRSLGMHQGYPRIFTIIRATCAHYDVSVEDVLSHRRFANLARPRQVAMYLARTMTLRSLPEIGRRFGGRDHTTVLHAANKIEGLLVTDLSVADHVRAIRAAVLGIGGVADGSMVGGSALP